MSEVVQTELEAALFRVETADGAPVGAAFAIGPKGLLVTCTHVLKDAGWPDTEWRMVRFGTDEVIGVKVLDNHLRTADGEDIAFVRIVGGVAEDLPSLELAPLPPPRGAELYCYGFPETGDAGGLPGRCRVTGPARIAGQAVLAIASDEVTVGFSGAPAIDEESGLVVGMVTAITVTDRFGKGGRTALLTPAENLAAIHPSARIGTDRRVRLYRKAVRARASAPNLLIIEAAAEASRDLFVAPAMREQLADGPFSPTSQALTLDALIDGYSEPDARATCLVGDAGAGKSAILRRVAVELVERRIALPVPVSATALSEAHGLDLSERLLGALRQSRTLGGEVQLPRDFLYGWARTLGQRFVVLVDGVDEIADRDDRSALLRDLKGMARELAAEGHALLVASRDVSELKALQEHFRRLVVEPLPPGSVDDMIGGVLGTDAADFRLAVDRVANRTLLDSPLVLQLLLGLYLSGERAPLSTVAGTFEAYLQALRSTWRRRGMPATPAAEHALDLLGIAAWCELTGDADAAIDASAAFLAEQLGLGVHAAESAATRVLAFLGAEGAIVRGKSAGGLDWVHLSFRDFLAARALCGLGNAMPGLAQVDMAAAHAKVVAEFWDDPANETFARFVLARSNEVGPASVLADLLEKDDSSAMFFVGRVVADGSRLPEAVASRFAERLAREAQLATNTCRILFTESANNPTDRLHHLLWFDPVFTAAVERMDSGTAAGEDPDQHATFCRELFEAASAVCSAEQIERLLACLGTAGTEVTNWPEKHEG